MPPFYFILTRNIKKMFVFSEDFENVLDFMQSSPPKLKNVIKKRRDSCEGRSTWVNSVWKKYYTCVEKNTTYTNRTTVVYG